MKRKGNLWSEFITFDNLYSAYLKARKGKQSRQSVAEFSFLLEPYLFQLQSQLEQGTYQPGSYRQFIIYERKPRLISAAPFRDRVVHHALMNPLEPILEKRFYYHSYACRKGKGTHKAVDQYQHWARQYAYVLKLDIVRYFPSIRHDVLKNQLARILKDKKFLTVLNQVIDSSPTQSNNSENAYQQEVGLPIGNLTSQYFANLYLNDIDHWIARQGESAKYLRYVDDLMIFANHKNDLWQLRDKLVDQLERIGLKLHPKKQQLYRTSERVDVLGYKISRLRRWLRNDNGYRFQRKYKAMLSALKHGRLSDDIFECSMMAWVGHAMHGETEGMIKHQHCS